MCFSVFGCVFGWPVVRLRVCAVGYLFAWLDACVRVFVCCSFVCSSFLWALVCSCVCAFVFVIVTVAVWLFVCLCACLSGCPFVHLLVWLATCEFVSDPSFVCVL